MGSGILPASIHQGQVCFLFGKENEFADTPGWSDFGGGTDQNETYLQTAIREGGEELTGFLGTDAELSRMLKKGTYKMDLHTRRDDIYRMHIFHYPYDERLPQYYNNNQRFLQNNLNARVRRDTKIFEKGEIRWISINELAKMKPQFRSYFQAMIEQIIEHKSDILQFLKKHNSALKTRKNKK